MTVLLNFLPNAVTLILIVKFYYESKKFLARSSEIDVQKYTIPSLKKVELKIEHTD